MQFIDRIRDDGLVAFRGVRYKGVFYQIESVFDDGITIRNFPFTKSARDEDGHPDSEIKLFLNDFYQLPKKRGNGRRVRQFYRYGYLAHFFYLDSHFNPAIVKEDLYKIMCPGSTYPGDQFFVLNMMDLLCLIGIYYNLKAISLQDEATNPFGFPLCENRFRSNTYIGTYEKYGFIRDLIDYKENGMFGTREPLEPKTPEEAAEVGNAEMLEDYGHARSHEIEIDDPHPEKKKKRKRTKDYEEPDKIVVHSESTLEELVSDYYTKLKIHADPKPLPPCNCFGPRVKYMEKRAEKISMVAYRNEPASGHVPSGSFFVQDLFGLVFNVVDGVLEIGG